MSLVELILPELIIARAAAKAERPQLVPSAVILAHRCMIQWHTVIALERSRFVQESRVVFRGGEVAARPEGRHGVRGAVPRASIKGIFNHTKFSNVLAEQLRQLDFGVEQICADQRKALADPTLERKDRQLAIYI